MRSGHRPIRSSSRPVYAITAARAAPGGPHVLVYWLQLLFAAGSIVLTYLIGSEIFGRRPGLFAALLMALYPPMQQSAVKILTEPMTMLLFLAYVYVQLLAIRRDRRWLWLLTGVLFAGAVMVRPNLAVVGSSLSRTCSSPSTTGPPARPDRPARGRFRPGRLALGGAQRRHAPPARVLADQTGDPLLAGIDPITTSWGGPTGTRAPATGVRQGQRTGSHGHRPRGVPSVQDHLRSTCARRDAAASAGQDRGVVHARESCAPCSRASGRTGAGGR